MDNTKLKQILRDGYRGGTMTGDKDGAKVTLHYTTIAQADRALDTLADTMFGGPSAPAASASIDTKEFRELLSNWFTAQEMQADYADAPLIAHIDQHVAAAVAYWKEKADGYKEMWEGLRAVPSPMSAVPGGITGDVSDPVLLWAEIHRLRAEAKGPDGFATWRDAAVAERVRRVKAESAGAPVSEAEQALDRIAFHNYGEQPEDTAHLDCPHCGGGGHKDDVRPADVQELPALPDEYMSNLLQSCENWLVGHAGTEWAMRFGHSGLMLDYAQDLGKIRAALATAMRQQQFEAVGLIVAPNNEHPDLGWHFKPWKNWEAFGAGTTLYAPARSVIAAKQAGKEPT